MLRGSSASRLSEVLRGEGEELREVAVVRGHRVGGGVAIQAEVLEKAAELFHRSQIRRAARSPTMRELSIVHGRSLRRRFRCPAGVPERSGGGMMPNVMLVG